MEKFKEELKQYQIIIEKELNKYVDKRDCPERILNESIEYSLLAGGKRLRPTLMLAAYKMFKENIEETFMLAVAMEMVHNFSLIHDDLPGIDNDNLRHGKPTNHIKFNEATAILAGDALLNKAYALMSEYLKKVTEANVFKKIEALGVLSEGIEKMIIGEYIDTEYEGKMITGEYLEYMHKHKTGALIKASVQIGAILADAPEDDIKNLGEFAEKIGLAFQIKDDILSEIGNEKILGKPVGNDRERGKATFIAAYGLKESQEILDIVIKDALDALEKYGDKAEFLRELTLYIKNREK